MVGKSLIYSSSESLSVRWINAKQEFVVSGRFIIVAVAAYV